MTGLQQREKTHSEMRERHSRPIRVMVVEDGPDMRERLVGEIGSRDDMTVVAAAATLGEAMLALETAAPDIVLVDLGLPDGDGTDLIHYVRRHLPDCEVMVITVFGDERHVLRAMDSGASGYLLKEEDSDKIASCIHQLLAGGSPMTPSIARHLLSRYRNLTHRSSDSDGISAAQVDSPLTEREEEVLRLIAKGFKSSEISEMLGVTYHTVTSHIRSIYRKLEVHSRNEAVFEAGQRGILPTFGN